MENSIHKRAIHFSGHRAASLSIGSIARLGLLLVVILMAIVPVALGQRADIVTSP
jgi:hypothetical protein